MKKITTFLKHFLANLIFPRRKDKQHLNICFIGVPGVGKSYLCHRLRFHKLSPCKLGTSSALKLQKFLKLPIPKEYQKVYNFFLKNYHKAGNTYILREIYSKILGRNIYIDETMLNHYPIEILKDFYKKQPKLFNEFFKRTLVICVKDTPENILKKVNKRIKDGKEHAGYQDRTQKENFAVIKDAIKKLEEKSKFLKTCTNYIEIQAQLPIKEKIKICKEAIKQFENKLSKNKA